MTFKKMLLVVALFSASFTFYNLVSAETVTVAKNMASTFDTKTDYKWNGSYVERKSKIEPINIARKEMKEISLPEGESDSSLDYTVRVNRKSPVVFRLNGMMGSLSIDSISPANDESKVNEVIKSASEKIGTIDKSWQGGFESRMAKMNQDKAVSYAQMLVDNQDSRLDDEIAWCLSHMTPEDLAYAGMNAEMIYQNALTIYNQAEQLDYVSVVELEDGHTTLEYTYGSGTTEDSKEQIPYEIYYNGVVNMKMDWERVSLIDPSDGAFAEEPTGAFWRSYFLDPEEPPMSYANHPVFLSPNDLHGENFPFDIMESDSVFTDFEVGPLNLVVRASDSKPVMIEFYPKNYAQTILATLLPVEKMAENGNSELLENMITYLNDGRKIAGKLEVLLLKERDPFGKATVENTLTDMEVTYNVITLDDLDTLSDSINFRLVKKIIVPSDQSLSFYQGLAAKRETVEALIQKGLCLQFHGAVQNEVDRWDGVVMPGGFTRLTNSEKAEADYLEGGYSKFTTIMENTSFVWDKQKYNGISGTRLFDPQTFALDKIGYWASEILIQNVSERVAHLGGSPERSDQPVRLSNNHYGNCGEDQDVLGSAAKTMLVPSFNVHNTTEDHVWNVLYLDDRWVPYQIDWSDEATRIDNAGISYDKQQGGGKDCACIIRSDGDGKVHSVIDLFSDYITLKITVTDANDQPIDGARVYVFSEAWQSEDVLSLGVWGVTDDNGYFETRVGENANYYLRVTTSIGSKPSLSGQASKAVDMADALAGEEFELSIKIDSVLDAQWEEVGIANIAEDQARFKLHMTSNLEWSAINGKNGYTGDTTYYKTETSSPMWAVMSGNQMEKYLEDGTLKALKVFSGEDLVELPKLIDNWYLMLIEASNSKEAVYSGNVEVWVEYPETIDGDDDFEQPDGDVDEFENSEEQIDGDTESEIEQADSGSGSDDNSDGCSQMNHKDSVFLLLLALIAVFVRRKSLNTLK